MCGIFGLVTKDEQLLGPILIEAARRLTYRGYDSVGAATISKGRIAPRKYTGRVYGVAARYNFAGMTGQRGITQLRWATFLELVDDFGEMGRWEFVVESGKVTIERL
jgi:glucosamine--fructose-6-phosphate aminotransferase (isomerizing)